MEREISGSNWSKKGWGVNQRSPCSRKYIFPGLDVVESKSDFINLQNLRTETNSQDLGQKSYRSKY